MSDLMDNMSVIMLKQSALIKDQAKQLNTITKLVPGCEEIEELKSKHYDEKASLAD